MLSKFGELSAKWSKANIYVEDFYTGPESAQGLFARWRDIDKNATILHNFRWLPKDTNILAEPFFVVNLNKFRIAILPEGPMYGQLPPNTTATTDRGFPRTVFTTALKGFVYDICGFSDIIAVILIQSYMSPKEPLSRCNMKNACNMA
jgi:hypothetical protein